MEILLYVRKIFSEWVVAHEKLFFLLEIMSLDRPIIGSYVQIIVMRQLYLIMMTNLWI